MVRTTPRCRCTEYCRRLSESWVTLNRFLIGRISLSCPITCSHVGRFVLPTFSDLNCVAFTMITLHHDTSVVGFTGSIDISDFQSPYACCGAITAAAARLESMILSLKDRSVGRPYVKSSSFSFWPCISDLQVSSKALKEPKCQTAHHAYKIYATFVALSIDPIPKLRAVRAIRTPHWVLAIWQTVVITGSDRKTTIKEAEKVDYGRARISPRHGWRR